MPPIELDPRTTALVLIDLQQGIVAGRTVPHEAADVVARAIRLARRFREHLARRGIRTIVLGGIATNLGVESTARAAHERGYEQVFAQDTMAAREPDLHTYPVTRVFPTIGRVCSTDDLLTALG